MKLACQLTFLVAIFCGVAGCDSGGSAVPEVDENFAVEQEKSMDEIAKEQEEQMRREREMFQ